MSQTVIISRDGEPIGIAELDQSGTGALKWFHTNVHSSSMSHALEHEGYSVKETEPDCRKVSALIEAIAARLGVTMTADFVPFSQSRHAKPKKGEKPWRSVNWRVHFSCHDREFLETDYSQGTGLVDAITRFPAGTVSRSEAESYVIESGREYAETSTLKGKTIPGPRLGDVLHSLARDADVIDAADFETWARDLGYDPDSRDAERIYRLCLENVIKFRAALGEAGLAEIQLAASFN